MAWIQASPSSTNQPTNPKHTLSTTSFPELSCTKPPRSITPGPGARHLETKQPEPMRLFELCNPVLFPTCLPSASHPFLFKPQQRLWAMSPPPGILADPVLPHVALHGTARPRLVGTVSGKLFSLRQLFPCLSSYHIRVRSSLLVFQLLHTPEFHGTAQQTRGEAPGTS